MSRFARTVLFLFGAALALPSLVSAQRTQKPVLHARHWIAITGKPMAATAGSMMYQKGGNAVDAAAAMLAATATMWEISCAVEIALRTSPRCGLTIRR